MRRLVFFQKWDFCFYLQGAQDTVSLFGEARTQTKNTNLFPHKETIDLQRRTCTKNIPSITKIRALAHTQGAHTSVCNAQAGIERVWGCLAGGVMGGGRGQERIEVGALIYMIKVLTV